jgi:hypothetical protein
VLWLLDQLPKSLTLALGSGEWEAQISAIVTIQDRVPAVFLSSDTLQRLANLGVSFDVDVYVGGDPNSGVLGPAWAT